MSLWDLVGNVAAALVLAAFCMRDMVPLRIAALCRNVAFIAYGLALGLAPAACVAPPDERLPTPGGGAHTPCGSESEEEGVAR